MPSAALPMSVWVTGDPVPRASQRAGSFADMIRATVGEAWSGDWSVVDATDPAVALPSAAAVTGVIVTGSPARIADQSAWMLRAQQAMCRLVELRVPILGICFGHQLLGAALGGGAGPNPLGREIGTVTLVTHGDDPLLPDRSSLPVVMTHLDIVHEVPSGATVLGSTALDPNAAVRFNETTWGVQFHPEMNASILRDYVETLRNRLVAEHIDPDAVLAAAQDTPSAAQLLVRFARFAAESGKADRSRR